MRIPFKGEHTTTNYFAQGRNLAAVGVAAVAMLTLSACDTGPECIESHSEMHMMPVYNGKTTILQPVWTTVCTKYAEPAEGSEK
ncbi:gp18 [Streptomyces phage phiBT1]|uniref:Gp18 n=1 Tax=Lomovskayavirus BT1 TaxID=225588 RepID=Q858Y5_9CAUD|nr:gp18 [Streptomyces phage phiBT1]CAD80140.1 gp18 [Lomovskayavirus BT1]